MFKFVLASSLLIVFRQVQCYPGFDHDGGHDLGIGGGIEHLPLDSGHGSGFESGFGGGHVELSSGGHGGHGGHLSLEGSDYHHGVSVVSIPAGKAQNFDLTGGHDGGKIFGGSFISAGAHGKTGGYAHGHGHDGGDVGAHYASVLSAGEHGGDIGEHHHHSLEGGYEVSEGHHF